MVGHVAVYLLSLEWEVGSKNISWSEKRVGIVRSQGERDDKIPRVKHGGTNGYVVPLHEMTPEDHIVFNGCDALEY